MSLSLASACISLFFLVADPLLAKLNERLYSRNYGKPGAENRFKAAMRRRGLYKTASIFFIIVASLLSIYNADKESQVTEHNFQNLESSIEQINGSMREIGSKVLRIEKFLWGGGGSDPENRPKDPKGGPGGDSGYSTIDERMRAIEEMQADIRQNAATKGDIEEIHREIIKLRAAIKKYEELMLQIKAEPAG